ncbi:uncharacterized protein LOC115242102 [Formica exsecta]|uniref:uncharacterized protein LOC115242102 n=1 Tax=Formica exsecta TaxID=72781 RepID=UPI00114332B6|nr:uncharacterized protein LOC115242102 [Formica exsecta]
MKKGKEILKQYKHNKQKYSSQSKSVDSDNECDGENERSPVHKQSKSQLADTITVLNEENKRLRRDNERLRRLRSVNEDLSKIDKMMKDLTVNLQSASWKTESFNHQLDQLQQKVQAIRNCIIEPDASPVSIVQNKELDLPSDKLKSFQRSVTEFRKPAPSRESIPLISEHNLVVLPNYNLESSPKDFPDSPDVAIKTVNTHELEHVQESNHAADKVKSSDDHQSIVVHKEKTIDLGGPDSCVVNATRLSLCNHTSASKLICEMMSLLFSKEELATSSLTGTVANFHREKAYVKNKFPIEKDFDKMFRKAVQQKCNNAVPRNRGSNNKGETNK